MSCTNVMGAAMRLFLQRLTDPTQRTRTVAAICGILVGSSILLTLCVPSQSHWSALGPLNTGHEQLACADCHIPVQVEFPQQIQSAGRALVALKHDQFGAEKVGNGTCLNCHDRPMDRHPVQRFLEPRFRRARSNIAAHECTGCHGEHHGVRLTVTESFCVECHQNMEVRDDPISPAHRELAEGGKWATCLQCHDFHGNHSASTPVRFEHAIKDITTYFNGGESPYGPKRLETPNRKEE